MSKDKRPGLTGQALKDVNASISKLRKLGLYSGKAARGQPTRYALTKVKQFAGVINGTASVVTIPKADTREVKTKFKGVFDYVKNKLIVPKQPLNAETVRYDKTEKTVKIFGVGTGGKKYRKVAGEPDAASGPQKPKKSRKKYKKTYQVVIPGVFSSQTFDSEKRLRAFMQRYDLRRGSTVSWLPYIQTVEIEA